MDSENGRVQNDVQDGLQNEHNPISRDPERTDEERAGDDAADQAEGVNEAAGPAEEEDQKRDDDRDLTTDTSPSD